MKSNFLTELSFQQLKQAVTIREKMEVLEQELDRIIGGSSGVRKAASPRRGRKGRMSGAARAKISAAMKARWAKRKGVKLASRIGAAKNKKGASRAPLKEQIVLTLQAAGKSGKTVKDLAAKLGKSYGNISVWFHTTAKGIKEIRKVEPGRFAWVS